MGLMEMMLSGENSGALSQLAKSFGLDESAARNAVAQLAPALSRGLRKNTADADGLASLIAAISNGNHRRYVENPDVLTQDETVQDGNKILGHLFGSKEVSRSVAHRAAGETGVDEGILKKMLPVVAAMAMGALSRKSDDLGLQQSPSASTSGGEMNMLTSFLDSDGDGSIMDDLFGMAKRFF